MSQTAGFHPLQGGIKGGEPGAWRCYEAFRQQYLLSLNELATSTFDKKAFEECCIKFSKLQRLFMMESLME